MISLLADPRLQDYNVIAIQKPWKNPFGATILSSHHSEFHLLYKPRGDTQVCSYVNEKLDPNSWEIDYVSADLCTLKIKVWNSNSASLIHIHNVYNPSPALYLSTESPSTLSKVNDALSIDTVEHILLGDFNLHHPYWSEPSRLTQHAAVDQLLDIIGAANMELIFSPGTVIWKARQSSSTIDLVFLSAKLVPKLEHCKTRLEIGQSSNHISISTKLLLLCEASVYQQCRAWKIKDTEKFKELLQNAPLPKTPQTITDIDTAVKTV